MCSIEDIEIVETGVDSVWTIDSQGNAQDHIGDFSLKAYYIYYNCNGCGASWNIEKFGKEECFKRLKGHLDVQS